MNKQIKTLLTDMERDIEFIGQLNNPLEKLNKVYQIIDSTMVRVKEYLDKNSFADKNEEMQFFKESYPLILAYRIQEVLKYNIIANKPIGTKEAIIDYFNGELNALQCFFRLNAFYYQYYKNNFDNLDDLYFLRDAGPLNIPLPEIPDTGNKYSTPLSFLYAKFIAYEKVQYFILQQIATERGWPKEIYGSGASNDITAIKWTGDVINIVELAYGLWLTGQLNNGNASLNHIVKWLERNLAVNIGIVQRRFSEIERRKRLSPTKYIDQMKDAVLQKIESDNA